MAVDDGTENMSWDLLCPVSFLLIPIRYRFILEIKHLAVTVEFIFGLYKKTMELPGKNEKGLRMRTKNRGTPFANEERPAAAQRAEMILADETEPEKAPEEKTKENKAEKHKESADEGKGKRKTSSAVEAAAVCCP